MLLTNEENYFTLYKLVLFLCLLLFKQRSLSA